MRTTAKSTLRTVHVRAAGMSATLDAREVEIAPGDPDEKILEVVAHALGLDPRALEGHAIDRGFDSMVVRPWAVWG